jgi:hypothetical protein
MKRHYIHICGHKVLQGSKAHKAWLRVYRLNRLDNIRAEVLVGLGRG